MVHCSVVLFLLGTFVCQATFATSDYTRILQVGIMLHVLSTLCAAISLRKRSRVGCFFLACCGPLSLIQIVDAIVRLQA